MILLTAISITPVGTFDYRRAKTIFGSVVGKWRVTFTVGDGECCTFIKPKLTGTIRGREPATIHIYARVDLQKSATLCNRVTDEKGQGR